MSQNRRTFPRIPVVEAGLLEFTPHGAEDQVSATGRKPQRVTVIIASAAREGLRLFVPRPVGWLEPDMRVDVRFHAGGQPILLSGEVVWIAGRDDGTTHVGVALLLELAAPADRDLWAGWIADQTRRAPPPPPVTDTIFRRSRG